MWIWYNNALNRNAIELVMKSSITYIIHPLTRLNSFLCIILNSLNSNKNIAI